MKGRASITDYLNLGNLTDPAWCARHRPIEKFFMLIVAILVLGVTLGSFVPVPRPGPRLLPTQTAQTPQDSWAALNDGQKPFWAREIVKRQLRDPDSAKFRGLWLKDKNTVCGEVNAKNGLGGYSGWQSFVVSNGGRSVVIDQPCP